MVLGVVGEGLVELGLETQPDRSVVLGYGGDAANTAVMAARLGCPTRIGGRVGDDALGSRLLTFWRSEGIDVSHVVVDPTAPTGIYANERGSEGLHRFDYHRRDSAGSRLASNDLGPGFYAGLTAVHVTGITLAVSSSSEAAAFSAIDEARRVGALVSLAVNHRPALGGSKDRLLEAAGRADIVFASAEEATEIGVPNARELVLTRGGAGAAVRTGGRETAVAGFGVAPTVDAAGAGDALAGAYLARRLAGDAPESALRVGVVAAGLSCRARGCALSYPSATEVGAALEHA